nr:immunoglobulin light chain junction region [Macaca mulatta]MOW68430.1 immunoglobulin light chain junction region [Macaca mulatta]MOW71346.1 immunoglobulin light chain junction region [Macaca mulatta]
DYYCSSYAGTNTFLF